MTICPPAIIYMLLTLCQIIYNAYYIHLTDSVLKLIMMVLITGLLVYLCNKGFSNVAWLIVLVPFLLMVVVTGVLIFVLGYNEIYGVKSSRSCSTGNITTDSEGNIIIYKPSYDATNNPVYYKNSYIVVPK